MLSSDLMIFSLPRLLGRACFLDFLEASGESEWIVFVVSIVVSELLKGYNQVESEFFLFLFYFVSTI